MRSKTNPAALIAALFTVVALVLVFSVPQTEPGGQKEALFSESGLGKTLIGAYPFFFGGPVVAMYECTCSGGFQVIIGPPIPGQFLYQPGVTVPFLYGVPHPGALAVGTYSPGAFCSAGTTACTPLPVQGVITTIGTSP